MTQPGANQPSHPIEYPPRALIVTIFGLHAREIGGWISISNLVKMMAALAVDERAVRSAISRLKRRGLLLPASMEGIAGYTVTEESNRVFVEGDRRIFDRPRAVSTDNWLLVVFSVPESKRDERYQIRSRLTWLGFGTVSSGVWIAPRNVESETRSMLKNSGLEKYVNLFSADYLGLRPEPEQVTQWWDLDAFETMYSDFISVFRPVLARWRRRRTRDPAAAFADFVRIRTHLCTVPYLDPGLPPELLPNGWLGVQANELFSELSTRLEPAAMEFAWEICEGSRQPHEMVNAT
ncbi:PaaX family transcriptional regulator [Rhodococcus sp. NPDC055024]